jgi:hypothetical protein
MPAHLAYLATGRAEIWDQALYAAWSAAAWRGAADVRIHLYTDRPDWFAPLASALSLEPLPAERQRAWVEPYGLYFRMKPMAFEDLLERFPGDPVIYADGDTVVTGPLEALLARIGPGRAVMHVREYAPLTKDSREMRNFRVRMARTRFRGAPIPLDPWMWNAGVVGLDASHRPLVQDWVDFIDETYPTNRRGAVEQYGISWLLQRGGQALSPCDDLVVHYYLDKPRYLALIRAELPALAALPLDEAFRRVRERPVRPEGPPPPAPRTPRLRRLKNSLATRARVLAVALSGRAPRRRRG